MHAVGHMVPGEAYWDWAGLVRKAFDARLTSGVPRRCIVAGKEARRAFAHTTRPRLVVAVDAPGR